VKVALRPSNAKRLYTDEKSTEKKRNNLSDVGGATNSIITPASIAIRVIEVRNPPTTKR